MGGRISRISLFPTLVPYEQARVVHHVDSKTLVRLISSKKSPFSQVVPSLISNVEVSSSWEGMKFDFVNSILTIGQTSVLEEVKTLPEGLPGLQFKQVFVENYGGTDAGSEELAALLAQYISPSNVRLGFTFGEEATQDVQTGTLRAFIQYFQEAITDIQIKCYENALDLAVVLRDYTLPLRKFHLKGDWRNSIVELCKLYGDTLEEVKISSSYYEDDFSVYVGELNSKCKKLSRILLSNVYGHPLMAEKERFVDFICSYGAQLLEIFILDLIENI